MATRLSVIATRTGDTGTTGLGDGSRVDKNAPRIEAMGNVDELNSVIGLLRTEPLPEDVDALFSRVQNDLFDLGAELCIPGHIAVNEAHVTFLDQSLERYNADLTRLKEFILPGGCRGAALAHLARTVCRRAERSVVAVGRSEAISTPARQYLNRLSDLCFVIARVLNREAGQNDVMWSRESSA
ncbi:MAG: cob(I)yrinic acid a,c-diamide adenosyltransferase [Pollutimonas bauzanensis]|uniref:Cobalamin adenosyltransferase n=1 Tax=Pollutimonas bauzanensis TaxID=658167 RepID=A0A1M5XXU6_9BURK|nr:cob(I)yrinic acid a,c-diamide adenosyltransferase [Pollutimonas bauzanensis]SHI04552.1 ATP:cob(I)alamin adenosyltransferase [Pollutimonas bauzanensis]